MDQHEVCSRISRALTDVEYAVNQLRRWRDGQRAMDALERVEINLTRIKAALSSTSEEEP